MVKMDTVTVRVQATNVGKEIGLTGQDLVDFVKEAVADAKMELAEAKKEAAAAKKESEAESARKEREADAERQHELEKLKLDNEKLKLDNDHAEKMAELEGIQNDQEGHPSNPFSGLFGPQIQLPKFNDEKDSLMRLLPVLRVLPEVKSGQRSSGQYICHPCYQVKLWK